MRKFLLRLLLFSCIFFVVDKLFYVLVAKAPSLEADKRLEMILEGKMNKDILIIGSSRAAEDILASQIEKETQQRTYNLGYQGSNIEFHYFLLKTLLKYNKAPKTILLTVDNPSEFIPVKSLNFRYDRLYPLVKYNYITEELIHRNQKNGFARFMVLARINKTNFDLTKRKPAEKNPLQSCGSSPFLLDNPQKKFQYTYDYKYSAIKEAKSLRNAFGSFQRECKVNNIRLIVCYAPDFKSFNANFARRMKQISYKENFTFIYDTTNAKYKNIDYFYDESHLNYEGAKLFTSEISRFINHLKK